MEDFSASRAIGAGFDLIRREPLILLAWGAIYLLVGLLPQAAMASLMLPEFARLSQQAAAGASAATSAELMEAQGRMMQLQPLSWLASIACQALLLGAAYRAVLFPEDRRFFYLRLGARELWMGLVMLVLFVMIFLLAFAIMLPTMLIAGFAAVLSGGASSMGLIAIPLVLAGWSVAIWVLLRLSLATPLSFAERGFKLFESWDLTRGHAGKMFGVALALFAMVLGAELVLVTGAVILAGGFGGLFGWLQHPQTDLSRLAPAIAVGAVVIGLLGAAFFAILGAAWGQIYRELTLDPTEAF